jgi:ATP-dependent Lhr-like helicase
VTVSAPLDSFHPAVAEWFRRSFPAGPTPAQSLGWPAIARGEDTLVAAPTGSGKTLAAFLVAIDRCLRDRAPAGASPATSVLYVSPLRALTVDVAENLEAPLAAIVAIGEEIGHHVRALRIAVRNGDTPAAARAAMLRRPPDIVVTTPESLYLLITARRGREMLGAVGTVIVDEIHALARDKRGSHLALSLERLDRLVTGNGRRRPTRIGCSATQRPIERIARLLVGAGEERSNADGSPRCAVVDVGHHRQLDLGVVLPADELGAVMTTEQLDEIVHSLADLVGRHRTTLIFVNTRKMAERLAHLLRAELGEDTVAAHHGSVAMERRLAVESRLRAGELRAVVATASLELGIDVGPVDLVCQIGSPRSINAFLQRVGRAEHRLDGVPKGRIYPMTRDELVECVALFGAVAEGSLDATAPPVAPLDILAQQIVAECAASGESGIAERELRRLVRHAAPFAAIGDGDLEAVIALVCDGVATGRGLRGAYVHRDRVNGVLRARRGASIAALTSGGAIPELADYRVVAEPDESVVGSVFEDFAVEAMVGDVFLLGSNSWRIRRVEQGTVRVTDARGAPPTVPFWIGEAPARTDELSEAVSKLRRLVEEALRDGGPPLAVERVAGFARVDRRPATDVVAYLAAGLAQLGGLPTRESLVVERFFDDTGGAQLVVHSPYGARVNRGLGLALRKRFCRTFDFELQAAASDDAVVLSLGPQHSFALETVLGFLSPVSVREVLVQAVLPTPIFTSRWRWNLNRALVSPRFRGSRHLPPAIQRMEADDLMAAIFPMLAACQENVSGPIEIPDHPLVRQTLDDCCTEAMDLDRLVALLEGLQAGTVAARFVETTEPSVLAHEILNGRPFTFLDDAPLENRRTRAISLRRGIPLEAHDLSAIDEATIDEVRAEVAADLRDPDELHDLLRAALVLTADERWRQLFAALADTGRAMSLRPALTTRPRQVERWCATECRREIEALFPAASFTPDHPVPGPLDPGAAPSFDDAVELAVRGHLELIGPATAEQLADEIGIGDAAVVRSALARVGAVGAALPIGDDRWWSRRLVARAHARQRDRERRRFDAVSSQHVMRFLLEWQHVAPGTPLRGVAGTAAVLAQLQGVEAPVGAWESAILRARVSDYQPHLLDELCAHGEVAWGRLVLPGQPASGPHRAGATPSRATPVALARREDLAWLLAAARGEQHPLPPGPGAAQEVLEALGEQGALFFSDLVDRTGRMPLEIAEALWDGVARGLVTSDGFAAVRALLAGRYRNPVSHRSGIARFPHHHVAAGRRRLEPALAGGRWSLIAAARPSDLGPDELAEAVAVQLLDRWGVVFRDLVAREPLAIAWRDVLWALRRLEARGVARGGRFVLGFSGEQFALPEALDALHRVAGRAPEGVTVRLSAADPLNLTGSVLGPARLPALLGRELTLVDGSPVDGDDVPARSRLVAS